MEVPSWLLEVGKKKQNEATKRTKDAFGSVACSSYLVWLPFLCEYIHKQLDKIQRLMNDDDIFPLTCNRKYFGVTSTTHQSGFRSRITLSSFL